MSVADLEKLVARLEAVTGRLEAVPRGGGSASAAPIDDNPEWYDDYIKIHDDLWTKFVNDSNAIGGDVGKQAALVKTAFDAHRTLLQVAAQNNAPSQGDLQALLKPLSDGIIAVQNFREANRPSKQFNFLSAISEGIPYLGWVTIAPKPSAYIVQMEESSQFYTNKILKEFRQSEPKLADWSNLWIKLLKGFQSYVKDQHSIGLKWNKDKPAATATSASTVSKAKGAPPPPPPRGGAPPPPPPGPPPPACAPSKPSPGKTDSSALFAELSKGSAITQGLKKVSDDMKTHKNPALKQSASALSPRPYSPPQFKKFTAPGSKPALPAKKPPVFELQNKKWAVEWQENNQNIVIEEPYPEQTLYMFKCTNCVVQVKGKMHSVTLDSCKKCGIVFEDLISTCEFINCQSVKAQANGAVPTISIDKTDGAQIYVNSKSIGAQIISAKSSEMNVCITKEDGDLTEFPLAEQFKTVWDGKNFCTTPMDLNL